MTKIHLSLLTILCSFGIAAHAAPVKSGSEYLTAGENKCRHGNTSACYNLGVLYVEGKAVDRDIKKAVNFLKKACKASEEEACHYLGVLYDEGVHVRQSYKEAKTYYEKACNLRYGNACANLARMYEKGHGVEQSEERAAEIYGMGCVNESPAACVNLGNILESEGSLLQAKSFYQKACEEGNAVGCMDLGVCYVNGHGVERSYENARIYFDQSCKLGLNHGCIYLEDLKKKQGVRQ